MKKKYNRFELLYNKQSVEETFFQRAVKMTMQILYDKGVFDNYANADKVLEDFLFDTQRIGDLSEQVNDVVHWFCS